MKNKLPKLKNSQCDICVVCEGSEEYAYMEKLRKLKVFGVEIKNKNANGISKIFNTYVNALRSADYKIVLILCDTDDPPHEHYLKLKKQLCEFHDLNKSKVNEILYFGNPCTMQIVLSHFANVKIKSRKKKDNLPLLQKYIGLNFYEARENEIQSIMKKLTLENFEIMKKNLKSVSKDDSERSSTNFLDMLDKICQKSNDWIVELEKYIYG